MRTIEVDDEVFHALESKAMGFSCTPNSVLRRILELDGIQKEKKRFPAKTDPVLEFLESQEFRVQRKAEEKYLAVLAFLYKLHGEKDFSAIESFGGGSRVYFSRSPETIKASAPYATVKQITDTPYYAMTTIDNKSKRKVLDFALSLFGYSTNTISKVLQTIPSSAHDGRHI